jgi:hypothetical protein
VALEPFVGLGYSFRFFMLLHRPQYRFDGGSTGSKAATCTQNNTNTDIHAFSGIRTHDPSGRAVKNSLCLRPRDHCGRHAYLINYAVSQEDVWGSGSMAPLFETSAINVGE